MTTIAYRDGVMAADGRVTSTRDIILSGRYKKLHKLRDGSLVGVCGFASTTKTYIQWLQKPVGERPSLGDKDNSSTIMVVLPNGKIMEHDWLGIDEMPAPFYALGSGRCAALAAMHMGADARKAIEIAAKLDPYTGGRISIMRLK